jgi:hypothetical protein
MGDQMTNPALDSYSTRAATTSLRLAMRKTGDARREALREHAKRFPGPITQAACQVKSSRRMSF